MSEERFREERGKIKEERLKIKEERLKIKEEIAGTNYSMRKT
jgi:hypothetical protein